MNMTWKMHMAANWPLFPPHLCPPHLCCTSVPSARTCSSSCFSGNAAALTAAPPLLMAFKSTSEDRTTRLALWKGSDSQPGRWDAAKAVAKSSSRWNCAPWDLIRRARLATYSASSYARGVSRLAASLGRCSM